MKKLERICALTALTAVCLLFGGCAGTVEETGHTSGAAASGPAVLEEDGWFLVRGWEGGELAMSASFQRENGDPITEGGVLLSAGEEDAWYPLNETGMVWVAGLPREGWLQVCLLDGAQEELGETRVSFSTGEVIDASTDSLGDGYVTLRANTSQVSLAFTLCAGQLLCSLHLMG